MTRIPPHSVVKSWPKPDYVHPQSRGTKILAVEIIFAIITLIVVTLRFYVRGRLVRNFGVDDWLIIPAVLVCLGLTVSTCISTFYGYGKHVWDLHPHEREISLRFAWTNMLLFTLCVTFTKLSILFFYLRLVTTRTYRIIILCCILFMSSWGISFILMNVFNCVPIRAYWTLSLPQDKCLDEGATLISNAAINMMADIGLVILPLPLVWQVQLPKKQKIGLMAGFGLGIIVCIAGILRLICIVQVVKSYDGTWEAFMAWIWSAVECNVGIICASIPSLKPLITKISTATSSSLNTNTRKSATRLRSLATRTHVESVWDASDDTMHKVSTTIQAGMPQRKDTVKSFTTLHRKSTLMENYKKRFADDGSEIFDLEAKGDDMVNVWDVIKTTEIDITSTISNESHSPRKVSHEF